MSAAEALKAARAAGVELGTRRRRPGAGGSLGAAGRRARCCCRATRPRSWRCCGPADDGWSAEDWQVFFDERAGIVEFDGGLPRAEAEARAFACCVVEWLNRNPERSPAGRCLGCGDREHAHDPLLPYGVEPTGHVWLHSRCWPAWYEARKAKAVSALTAMGISAPVVRPMKREEQSKHLPSDATRESRTAKNQFAFQRQMNGG